MKREVARGNGPRAELNAVVLAEKAALALLARSIRFRHRRLALIRLNMAVQANAEVPSEHWVYCREVATQSKDGALRAMFLAAARAAPSSSDISASLLPTVD